MIAASNRADRVGAVFSMILPVARLEPAVDTPRSGTDHPAPTANLSILVVEDEPYVRQFCERIINSGGHRAIAATSVEGAMSRLDRESYDVVLCDQFLAGGRGMDILSGLRSRGRPEANRFILMTGSPKEEIEEDVDILFKPFNAELLMKTLTRVGGISLVRKEGVS